MDRVRGVLECADLAAHSKFESFDPIFRESRRSVTLSGKKQARPYFVVLLFFTVCPTAGTMLAALRDAAGWDKHGPGGVGRRELPQPPANCCKASGLLGGTVPPPEDVRYNEGRKDPGLFGGSPLVINCAERNDTYEALKLVPFSSVLNLHPASQLKPP
jgi:hypothetical protein